MQREPSPVTGWRFMIWAVAAWGAGGLVFFRQFVFSGFDRVFGDIGDCRLIVYLHEHLYHVAQGLAPLTSPAMFYPKSGVLGYTDAFLLDVLLYAPLRLLGCDPFLSFQLTWVSLSLIGFVSFAALLVRFAGVRMSVALVGSALFVFSNMLMNEAGFPQLFAVYFAPVLALLFLEGLRGLDRMSVRSFSAMFFLGLLDALTFSTGFYVAWFFNFMVVLAILITAAARPSALRELAHRYPITGVLRLFSVCMCGFAIGMIPFVAIYGPVLLEFHGHARAFDEYLFYAPRLSELLINVGENNMIWGKVLKASGIISLDRIYTCEYAVTPCLLVSAMAAAFAAWRRRILGGAGDIAVRAVILGSVAAVALMFLITARFNDWSAFNVVAAIIPGASAIRAGGRFAVVGSGFLVAAAAIGVDRGLRSLSFPWRSLLYALMVMCLLEQVNFVSPANISRSEESQRLAVVPSPPETCRCFFIAPQANRPLWGQQVDAILISQTVGIPTLNGYSAASPPGWDLWDVGDPLYSLRAWQWADLHGITEGLFEYKVAERQWQWLPAEPSWNTYSWGAKLDFSAQSPNARSYMIAGWSGPEDWGAWSIGVKAVVGFIAPPPTEDLVLELGDVCVFAKQPVDVVVNGEAVYHFTNFDSAKSVSIPVTKTILTKKSPITIEFLTPQSTTPLSHGINGDTRQLGIGLRTLALMPKTHSLTLERRTVATIVDFKKSAWPGVISSARGLSFAEPWGTWSSSDVVTLEFSKPLPEKFAVHLVASAFGPNLGKDFVAHVGDSAVRFTLAGSPEERVLEFTNPKRSKIIKIDVPSPCSPKELGLSDGDRSLGIGLTELRVEPLVSADSHAR